MKLKTNIIIGAIFALLLAFVYFHEIRGGQERRQAAERSKQLLDFNESEVERLALIRPEGSIEVERIEGQWRVVLPVEDGADGEAAADPTGGLPQAERGERRRDGARARFAPHAPPDCTQQVPAVQSATTAQLVNTKGRWRRASALSALSAAAATVVCARAAKAGRRRMQSVSQAVDQATPN